ncbi:4-hydroxythreonine-4-phosphate dehydrogenase PdxA [Parvularcula marina]|uniref:4-hydroxythreonine-4-phosphate dehydrogenase PdxA n=1 Tax=Parvularcula marina TaxID=2292771 RepID=UPI003518140A
MTTDTEDRLPLAVSMGEPGGVGTEILLKAWKHFSEMPPGQGPTFFLIDDPMRVERVARAFNADIPIATLSDPSRTQELFPSALPVMALPEDTLGLLKECEFGKALPASAPAVVASIDRAVELISEGAAGGLVTLPIQKEALADAGFAHPGHTEYLEKMTAKTDMPKGVERGAVMILTAGPFRVVPMTVHVSLSEVPALITKERIFRTGLILAQALVRDYGIPAPRIAVAGLNPHAGEGGKLGKEEQETILPAISMLRERGIDAIGPFPADTMFHEEARTKYSAALCMYHDQALIPMKTAAFYAAVNTTLGLPIVRTSPDHGTGLDIAGKGHARPDSLINAIYSADRMVMARNAFQHQTNG